MMRLALALVLTACGPAPAPVRTPSPLTLTARQKFAYAEATAAARRGDFQSAIRILTPFELETAQTRDDKLAYWIHNEQTWLHWAAVDSPGALAETLKGSEALDRSTLDADAIASMRLHALWDRAYLLVEMASTGADAARADYEALAKPRDDHDGMAVLEAFFMAKRKKGREAIAAAKKVDVDKDEDLQDLYVIALAFDAGADEASALAVRKRICVGNDYLMKPIILARMAREGFDCVTGASR